MFKTTHPLTPSDVAARLAVVTVLGLNLIDDEDLDDEARAAYLTETQATRMGLRGASPADVAMAAMDWCSQGAQN